eukprot:gene19030-38213_t
MSIDFNANADIIGRSEINDIEAILAIPGTDPHEVEHVVKDNADAIFTWDYSLTRPALRKLYEKAKTGQWNGTTDLPWNTEVDVERVVAADQRERSEEVVIKTRRARAEFGGSEIGGQEIEKRLLRIEARDDDVGGDGFTGGEFDAGGATLAQDDAPQFDAAADFSAVFGEVGDEAAREITRAAD